MTTEHDTDRNALKSAMKGLECFEQGSKNLDPAHIDEAEKLLLELNKELKACEDPEKKGQLEADIRNTMALFVGACKMFSDHYRLRPTYVAVKLKFDI